MKKIIKINFIFIFIFAICSCNSNNNITTNQNIIEDNNTTTNQNIIEDNENMQSNLIDESFINLNFKVPNDATISKNSNEDFSSCKITFTNDSNDITININYFKNTTIEDVYGSDDKVNKGNVTFNNNTYLLATKKSSYFYFLQNGSNVYLIRFDSNIDDENIRNDFMNSVSI